METSRTAIVVNRHAGTVRSMGEDAVKQLIAQSFGDGADVALLDGSEIERHIRHLVERGGVERLIVGGGDGTVASAAGLVAGTSVALGILPLGTMNMMAQTIGMESDFSAALKQFATAQVRPCDAGRANGQLFLHHVAFGLQPRMVRIREHMGYSSRFTKMLAATRASIAVLLAPQSMRLRLRIDSEEVEMRTFGLVISNNIYENSLMLKQARLDEGVLGVYALTPMPLLAFLRLAFDALRGRWRENTHVKELRGRSLRLTRHRRFGRESHSIRATIDGELTLFDLPLTVTSDPAALQLLIPATTSA